MMLMRVGIYVFLLFAMTRLAWADAVPAVGSMAPAFALSDQSGREVSLARFARRYTFLIDAQGKIVKTFLKVDTSKHSAEIIADLKQLSATPGN